MGLCRNMNVVVVKEREREGVEGELQRVRKIKSNCGKQGRRSERVRAKKKG